MTVAAVLEQAAAHGVPVDQLWVAPELDVVPRGPHGPWLLVARADDSIAIGGMDRGHFTLYGSYETDALAVNALRHLFGGHLERRVPGIGEVDQLAAQARALASGLAQRAAAGEQLDGTALPVGLCLDHLGTDSGHVLFPLGTPFPRRSAPPTDLHLPRTGYLVRQAIPASVRVEPVAPWFGQPGGGMMVTLDRPIRWYHDTGRLDAVDVTALAPA